MLKLALAQQHLRVTLNGGECDGAAMEKIFRCDAWCHRQAIIAKASTGNEFDHVSTARMSMVEDAGLSRHVKHMAVTSACSLFLLLVMLGAAGPDSDSLFEMSTEELVFSPKLAGGARSLAWMSYFSRSTWHTWTRDWDVPLVTTSRQQTSAPFPLSS
eukprot:2355117-Amphidinium_carterae.1